MKHNWLNTMSWSQAKSNLRDKIIHIFQETRSRVVYEDLAESTGIPNPLLDTMLCQICAKDYQLGRARADSMVTPRNKLLPAKGYFLFRLHSKRLSPDQDQERFYEDELALCCKEFDVELKPGCVQLELWDGKERNLIPLKEIEKRNPDMLRSLKHSGKRYRQALPPKGNTKRSKAVKRKSQNKGIQ